MRLLGFMMVWMVKRRGGGVAQCEVWMNGLSRWGGRHEIEVHGWERRAALHMTTATAVGDERVEQSRQALHARLCQGDLDTTRRDEGTGRRATMMTA